ncbi:unnamed protein product, partial [Prorocentrum cordatum]
AKLTSTCWTTTTSHRPSQSPSSRFINSGSMWTPRRRTSCVRSTVSKSSSTPSARRSRSPSKIGSRTRSSNLSRSLAAPWPGSSTSTSL